MKLNIDCVRDILIYLEENLSYNSEIDACDIELEKYDSNEILYCISLLYDAGYIKAITAHTFTRPVYIIQSLTFQGHDLLDKIRDKSTWMKIKSKISNITSSISLSLLNSVATTIITDMLFK